MEKKTYCVTFRMTARVDVIVDAKSEEEAKQLGEQFMIDSDFGACKDIEWDDGIVQEW